MNWRPWRGRRETRGYTLRHTEQALDRAGDDAPAEPEPQRLAVVTEAAGWWSRAFAGLRVDGDRSAAVSGDWLARVGEDLARRGEHLSLIEVAGAAVTLSPACSWDVIGWPDGRVRVELPEPGEHPDGTRRRRRLAVDWQGTVHLVLDADPAQPWRGRPRWQSAEADLLARTVRYLDTDLRQVPGRLLTGPGMAQPADNRNTRRDLRKLRGETAVLEGVHDKAELLRMEAAPAASLPQIVTAAEHSVRGALGLVEDLQTRDGHRAFVAATIRPLAGRLEAELRRKLEAPSLRLDPAELLRADLQVRARAYRTFTDAGLSDREARALCDLPAPEGGTE
ncbi:MAG: hypothetical protein OXH59_12725 [Rhodospirillaceae bacterium]|nr:hypothetical protein [Rhodospirillaceae bacterium]